MTELKIKAEIDPEPLRKQMSIHMWWVALLPKRWRPRVVVEMHGGAPQRGGNICYHMVPHVVWPWQSPPQDQATTQPSPEVVRALQWFSIHGTEEQKKIVRSAMEEVQA